MGFSLYPWKLCREQLLHGPRILGMETSRAFGSGYWFASTTHQEGPWVMPIVTFGILTFMAIRTHMGGPRSLLRGIITFYIFATALVEIVRVIWDVSRFALVFAALHNLPEVAITSFLAFPLDSAPGGGGRLFRRGAQDGWLFAQLWFLVITQFIMFLPTLVEVGAAEELTGLGMDWALFFMWARLYQKTPPGPGRDDVWWGLAGSIGHMLEILPLLALLLGVFDAPSIAGCIIVSFTTPITMHLYSVVADRADARAAAAAETASPASPGAGAAAKQPSVELISHQDGQNYLGLKPRQYGLWIVGGLLASAATIGLLIIIPYCDLCDIKVTPGHELGHSLPITPGMSQMLTNTADGRMRTGSTSPSRCPPGAAAAAAEGEQFLQSSILVAGTTTVWAYPGQELKLQNLLGSMPGMVQQEEGNIYYKQIVSGPSGGVFKFAEAWSSQRTLYKHLLQSPTVQRVFRGDLLKALAYPNITVEPNWGVMIPQSEALAEQQPWTDQFKGVLNASPGCLWDHINNWSNDFSWIMGAKGITRVTDKLRIVHFDSLNLTEVRQTNPLPDPPQPPGGYRLVYWLLDGYLVGPGTAAKAVTYRGELTLEEDLGDPQKTLLTYRPTVVPKSAQVAAAVIGGIRDDFNKVRIPFLEKWGQEMGEQCRTAVAKPGTGHKWFASA